MKAFSFRLERVLKWKQQRERLAELRQKQAMLAVESANATVALLQERLTQTALSLGTRVGRAIDTGAWLAHYHHSVRIAQALEAAEAKARQAAQALQEAHELRAKASVEVEALVHLRHQQREISKPSPGSSRNGSMSWVCGSGWPQGGHIHE